MPQQSKEPDQPDEEQTRTQSGFPVVGIGASAGGLEALTQFFNHMPANSGLTFVIIVHLAPDYNSMLHNILQKHTDMPVYKIEEGMQITPNSVYVIVPNRDVGLINGVLQLFEPSLPAGQRVPIDFFFRSLANDQAEKSIAILLSGTGSNGSAGLKAIKSANGLVVVQTPDTAKFDGMPRNALATGLVDYVLSPEEMPAQLLKYATSLKDNPSNILFLHTLQNQAALHKVLALLHDQTGHDFSSYKQNTIERRLGRRMAVHHFELLPDYAHYLAQKPAEITALFRELLIGVTNFFRDREAFKVLKEKVLPYLLKDKPPQQPLRIWVAGCATGEEAYSIAIAVKEFMTEQNLNHKVQIFASDINSESINTARQGIYPDGIAVDISPERLNLYFNQENGSYRINSQIREMVIFAEQSIIKDAPFSQLDLVSCRNLLIYLQPGIQQKVVALFHYSLKQDGILFLGTSETRIESNERQFVAFDHQWKFFRRVTETPSAPYLQRLPQAGVTSLIHVRPLDQFSSRPKRVEKAKSPRPLIEHILLSEYTPAALIVNAQGEIMYIHGQTAPYLHTPSGGPPFNILDMVPQEMYLQLRLGIHEAIHQKETVVHEQLRIEPLAAAEGAAEGHYFKLTIQPILELNDESNWVLIVFEAIPAPAQTSPALTAESAAVVDKSHIEALEQDLALTKAYLQTTIEELETTNEDVRAANEELQAANEELQSLNEELHTSQEELRSSNEELIILNTDHQQEIQSLRQSHDDVHNLLLNSRIAIIFLNMALQIKHFTPPATNIIRILPADVGRSLNDLTINLDYADLIADAESVLKSLVSKEFEVQGTNGKWYNAHIVPYRTADNMIGGIVMTFVDITAIKKSKGQQVNLDFVNSIIDTLRDPILVLTVKMRVVMANRAFYQMFKVKQQETEQEQIYDLGNRQWDISQLRRLLEQIIPQDNSFEDLEVEWDFPTIGRRTMRLNGRRLQQKDDSLELILLVIEDITQRR